MSLREIIAEFDFRRFELPAKQQTSLDAALDRLGDHADGQAAKVQPVAELVDLIIMALRDGMEIPGNALKQICLGGLPALSAADADGEVLQLFLRRIEQQGRENLFTAIMLGYLAEAGRQPALDTEIRAFLDRHRDQLASRWRERIDAFHLLEPEPGQWLADRLMEGSDAETMLKNAGLRGALSSRGYAEAVFLQYCASMARGYDPSELDRFLRYCEGQGLRFPHQLPVYATALLGPWLNPDQLNQDQLNQDQLNQDPGAEMRKRLQAFFLAHFPDPRSHPDSWASAQPFGGLLRRWLDRDAIDTLLDIIDLSDESEDWQQRGAFWRDCIHQGLVDEVWPILGASAQTHVRLRELNGEQIPGSYGRLRGFNAEPNQSALVMRAGEIIISEWSHAGVLRAYSRSRSGCPQLYRDEYLAHELGGGSQSIFDSDHSGDWQRDVLQLIKI
ncbi:MAG: EH signature domain-containing protein [Gammaproteobacteria bacterium]